MRKMAAVTWACALAVLPANADAAWLVYTQADASAYGGTGQTTQHDRKCSGSLASASYCGSDAQVYSSLTQLTSQAVADVPGGSGSIYGAQHGDGFAAADLATGQLRIADHARSQFIAGELTTGFAYAQFQDVLRFASTSADPFSVTVRVHVDGLFEGNQQPRFSLGLANGIRSLNGTAGWSDNPDGVPSCVGNPTGSAIPCGQPANFFTFNVTEGWSQFGPSDFVGTLLFDAQHLTASIAMALSAGGGTDDGLLAFGTYAEFGHTASIRLELPPGVSFTSESGAFLTASPVPEPATWAMLVGGFGVAGGALRRRDRKRIATAAV